MEKDWVAIASVVIALIVVGLIYLRGAVDGDLTGGSIQSVASTPSTSQTILGIALLFVLVVSIFFMINSSYHSIRNNFHK